MVGIAQTAERDTKRGTVSGLIGERSTLLVMLVLAAFVIAGVSLAGTASAQDGSNFNVTITDSTSPVAQGDVVEVTVDVTNTGDSQYTQSVNASMHSMKANSPLVEELGSKDVTLSSGETTTVTFQWDTTGYDTGDYKAQVESGADNDWGEVIEVRSAVFQVSIPKDYYELTDDDRALVDVEIENTGDIEGTQTISWTARNSESNPFMLSGSFDATLASGESGATTVEMDFSDKPEGVEFDFNVTSDDDTAGKHLGLGSADFSVRFDSAEYEVVQGDVADITGFVTNDGQVDDTATVEMNIYGNDGVIDTDTTTVSVPAGGSTPISFAWDSTGTPPDGYEVGFSLEGSSDEQHASLVVLEATPTFEVEISDSSFPVMAGQTAEVTTLVTNTGDGSGTQSISFELDKGVGIVDKRSVSLDPGESQEVTLVWDTAEDQAGLYGGQVSSSDDHADIEAEVLDDSGPASFDVSITHDTFPVTAGELVQVTARIANSGDRSDTQPISLAVSDGVGVVDDTAVTLAAGESQSITLAWLTAEDQAGQYAIAVESDDDSDEVSGDVLEASEAPYVSVANVSANDPITVGETLHVEGTVVNNGGFRTTQEIVLRMVTEDPASTEEVDSQTVTLDADESTDVAFAWESEWGDNPAGVDYIAEIASANDSERQAVEVRETVEPADFQVTILGSNAPVTAGETVEVEVEIENVGGSSGTQDVSLAIDGEVVTVESLTLDAGESVTLTLRWETEAAGDSTATVSSDDDEDAIDLTVHEEPYFEVEIQETTTEEDGSVTVEATIENRGDMADTQMVTLASEGTDRDSLELQLDSGESQTVEFSYDPSTAAGESTFEIASQDSSDDAAVTLAAGGGSDSSMLGATVPRLLMLAVLVLILIGYFVRRRMTEREETDP